MWAEATHPRLQCLNHSSLNIPPGYGPSMWTDYHLLSRGPNIYQKLSLEAFCPEPGESDLTCFILASRSTQGQIHSSGGAILTRSRARNSLQPAPNSYNFHTSRNKSQSLPGTRPRGGSPDILRKKSFRMHLSDPKLLGRISTHG